MKETNSKTESIVNFARFSWVIPVVAIFAPSLVKEMPQSIRVITDLVMLIMCVAGFLLAVYSIFHVRLVGRKKVLFPAILGFIMNGLLISIWVSNCIVAANR